MWGLVHEARLGADSAHDSAPCHGVPRGVRVGQVESSVRWEWVAGAKEVELGVPGEAESLRHTGSEVEMRVNSGILGVQGPNSHGYGCSHGDGLDCRPYAQWT